jgi:4-hydroxythreonine-4-phosphate dehydrogenase
MNRLFGITMGDSSGVGPEILLHAFHAGELRHPFVAYGDVAALRRL